MTETERQRDAAAANQQPEGRKLSTADMAAAAQQGSTIAEIQRDSVPATEPQPVPKLDSVAQQSAVQPTSLLAANDTHTFQSRWDSIQTGFVDEPRQAVEQADTLVAEVMQRLAETFAQERAKLEGQWSRGDNVSTEDLRLALQRYRSFFTRLLAM